LIPLAALIIDGGSIMTNRRIAQAAADAGALAGARELCFPTGADPIEIAESYALSQHEDLTANAQLVNGLVSVTTSISNDSFFAKIFHEISLDAGAEADAGCFPPVGNFVLPVGWSCRPPVGEVPFDPELGCKMMALDWTGLLKPLIEGPVNKKIEIPDNTGYFKMSGDSIVGDSIVNMGEPPKQIYIIMDNASVTDDIMCKEDLLLTDPLYVTAIKCDLNNDGKNDIEGSGNRGWLDLNGGGGGASELVGWIENPLDFPVASHTWLSLESGNKQTVYKAIKDHRQGEIVLIPIFNAICPSGSPTSACMTAAHTSPRPEEPLTGDIGTPPQDKFHVITFDAFYISCVHEGQSDFCPGFELAKKMNPDPKKPGKSLIPDNQRTVEGYFLTNVDEPLDLEEVCEVNLGNCTVSLTK
jgi:hypothetical protein